MEYCEMGSIGELIKIVQYKITEEEIASILKQVLLGLDYLHNKKKVGHFDLKANNILIDS